MTKRIKKTNIQLMLDALRNSKTTIVAVLSAAVVLLGALLFSSSHIHKDCTTRDTCPICRFHESGYSTKPEVTTDRLVHALTPVSLVPPFVSATQDLFRFHPVYAHAPPPAV